MTCGHVCTGDKQILVQSKETLNKSQDFDSDQGPGISIALALQVAAFLAYIKNLESRFTLFLTFWLSWVLENGVMFFLIMLRVLGECSLTIWGSLLLQTKQCRETWQHSDSYERMLNTQKCTETKGKRNYVYLLKYYVAAKLSRA